MPEPTTPALSRGYVEIQVESCTPTEPVAFVSDTNEAPSDVQSEHQAIQRVADVLACNNDLLRTNCKAVWFFVTTPPLWADLMTAASFVYWPPLQAVRLMIIFIVVTIAACLISMAVIYCTPRTRSRQYEAFGWTTFVVLCASLAIPYSTLSRDCIS